MWPFMKAIKNECPIFCDIKHLLFCILTDENKTRGSIPHEII